MNDNAVIDKVQLNVVGEWRRWWFFGEWQQGCVVTAYSCGKVQRRRHFTSYDKAIACFRAWGLEIPKRRSILPPF